MPNNPVSSLVSRDSLERKHEASEPQLRYAMIFAVSAGVMLLASLVTTALFIHWLSRSRPMQSMRPLGIISAPDLKPLERFPKPNLEIDDGHAQMISILVAQNQKLNTYGWVDRSNEIIRIPIDRAMDLLLQRGLPSRTNGVSQTGVSALRLIQERPEQP
ncbi:MAG TPA: hypothetical protein VGI03_14150 [Verrucomicrobiae bacterium]|jgi:hypothetical protein